MWIQGLILKTQHHCKIIVQINQNTLTQIPFHNTTKKACLAQEFVSFVTTHVHLAHQSLSQSQKCVSRPAGVRYTVKRAWCELARCTGMQSSRELPAIQLLLWNRSISLCEVRIRQDFDGPLTYHKQFLIFLAFPFFSFPEWTGNHLWSSITQIYG